MKGCRSFPLTLISALLLLPGLLVASETGAETAAASLPRALSSYQDANLQSIGEILLHRIQAEPLNLAATLIFFTAIIHTFLSSRFLFLADRWEHQYNQKKKDGLVNPKSTSLKAGFIRFLGEVEVIFGIWAIVLGWVMAFFYDWHEMVTYFSETVNYTEPMFVVVIMTLAASRPIVKLVELILWQLANRLGGSLAAWWITILTLGPLLGSLITESAAMTLSALLLADKFFSLRPSQRFQYATIALLFVNVSVGGTLTHFAAPPVLMVAGRWGWDLGFMMGNFGWKAVLGILLVNGIYFYRFRAELTQLQVKYAQRQSTRYYQRKYVDREEVSKALETMTKECDKEAGFTPILDKKSKELKHRLWEESTKDNNEVDPSISLEEAINQRFEMIRQKEMAKFLPGMLSPDERPPYRDPDWDQREDQEPFWIMIVHAGFLAWTVINAHHPPLFIGGFLFFLGFAQVTAIYQNRINLKPALLVGFFLAGLVVHGGMQAWWIEPVLGKLSDSALMVSATIMTSFNDNAAIAYLSTFLSDLTPHMKYAVIAGAVTGGGLTVIANAPNPAGQSILKGFFVHGISPIRLLGEALIPTLIMGAAFWFMP